MQPLSLPVLASAAASPILEFERRILDSMTDIEHWFRQSWQEHTPPFLRFGRPEECGVQAGPGRYEPVPRRV